MHRTLDKEGIAYVMHRVERAILTLNALPDREAGWLYNQGGAWPDVLQSVNEAYGYSEARPPKFRPRPKDIDEMQEALSWLCWLKRQNDGQRDFKIVFARAFGAPWWKLAARYGKAERTVKRWHEGAFVKMWAKFTPVPPNA